MVRYLGAQYPATRNQGYDGSVTLINAGVKLSTADSQWELNLECKNCGDKAYVTVFLIYRLLQSSHDLSRHTEVPLRWIVRSK